MTKIVPMDTVGGLQLEWKYTGVYVQVFTYVNPRPLFWGLLWSSYDFIEVASHLESSNTSLLHTHAHKLSLAPPLTSHACA